MYSCVKAYTRSNVPGSRFKERILGPDDGSVRSFLEGSQCQLVLTNSATEGTYLLNLEDAADLIYRADPRFTVEQWLTSLGDTTLPTTTIDPAKFGVKTNVVKYNDLLNAGYDPQLTHPWIGDGNELPESELTDIKITKDLGDYEKIYRNCLFTANGLLHISDYSTAGIRVTDAGRSVQHANANQLGIISFQQLGELTFIPIKREMMKPLTEGGKLKDGFSISFGPEVDLSKKVAMISLGGVLHHSNQYYRVQGDNSMVIEWWNFPLMRRYFDTKGLMDWSKFEEELDRNPRHFDTLDMTKAMSDDAICAFMEFSQTFAILLDADSMYYSLEEVEQTDLPGRYYTYSRPGYPLQLDNGLLAEYIAKPESGTWVLCIDTGYNYNYYAQLKPPVVDDYAPSVPVSTKPFQYCRGWLLELGNETLG